MGIQPIVYWWTLLLLDESICHFKGVRSMLSLLFYFWKILFANNVGPDQTPHNVASDLGCTVCRSGLHCLPMEN